MEEESHLHFFPDDMETLVLDDNHPSSSNSPPPSTTTSAALAVSRHPLSPPPEITTFTAFDPPDLHHFPSLLSLSLPTPHHPENPNSSSSLNSFLEPPSYDDAMFRSFDGEPSDIDGHGGGSDSSSSECIHISVSDPQKVIDTSNSIFPGGKYYFTYLIPTRTNLPEYKGTEFRVRKRFRDVVTLSDRLAEAYRGFFIPLRPDKNVVESQLMQKNEFVEQRRVAIEKYSRKLVNHPVIRKSNELRVFLQVEGRLPLPKNTDVASRMLDGAAKLPKQLLADAPAAVVPVYEMVQPAKGGNDLLRTFKELRQSVANDWGGSKPLIMEEDKEFLENKDKLQDLEYQLSNVSLQAESLVKAQQYTGETMGELGLAFVKLTKFETEEALYETQRARATDMKNVATAAIKASRLSRELNAQTVKHLDKLHDYLGMMLSVDNAFAHRSSALLTVQTLVSEISSWQSRIEKLEVASSKIFGGDRTRIRKIEELKRNLYSD